MTQSRLQTIRTPDGRQLAYAEWGAPDGFPTISIHGTPGCRLGRHPNQDLVRNAGIRLITFDRAGYGQSDRNPGRRVVDVVPDVRALADALGFEKFALAGGSGGGPHTLAVAALMPERITRTACIVGIAPYDALGWEEWTRGMDQMNVKEFGWAVEGEDRLVEELAREAHEMRRRVEVDPSTVLGDFVLPEADRTILAREDIAQIIRDTTKEQFASGVWGWVDDDLAFTRGWGFDPSTVKVPTAIWWGAEDVLVPPQHGEWLAANVPDRVVRVMTGAGHQADPDNDFSYLSDWLRDGTVNW
jgi:pimeloyl-ACP methyl ester carboxylesterase